MKKIFNFGIKIINNLKYPRKFMLIGTIFLVPLITVLYLVISLFNSEVDVRRRQIEGLEYIKETTSLVKHVQEHRGLSLMFYNGNESVKEKILEKEKEIKENVEVVKTLEKEYGSDLDTNNELEHMLKDIDEIFFNNEKTSLKEIKEKHNELINELIAFNGVIAEHSSLALQDKLDTYHLSRSIVYELPNVCENIALARGVGSGIAAKKSITSYEKFEMVFLEKLARTNFENAVRGMNVIYEERADLKNELSTEADKVFKSVDDVIKLINNEIIETNDINIDSNEYFDKATASVEEFYTLIELESNILMNILVEENTSAVKYKLFVLGLSIATVLILIYIFMSFYYGIMEIIKLIIDCTKEIADGNLRVDIPNNIKDETSSIIDGLNNMVKAFSEIIAKSKTVSNDVGSSTDDLAKITEETASAANIVTDSIQTIVDKSSEQIDIVNKASEIIEEMSKNIDDISNNCNLVLESSKEASDFAQGGNQKMIQTVNMMNNISDSVNESNIIINSLGKKSQNIGRIVETITEITEQTNLLALNASIEASRAGESGRGFAVVAEEVRKLAEESAKSTREIAEIINSIQKDSIDSVEKISTVTNNVRDGLRVVNETSESFKKILSSITSITEQINKVSQSCISIEDKSKEVTSNIVDVSNISNEFSVNAQEIVASSEEQLASTEEISSLANLLNSKVNELEETIQKFMI